MTSHLLVIAPAAQNDLKDINQYGLRQWGRPHCESYLAKVKKQFCLRTQQPLMGTERPELMPDTRSFPVESHTLFYRVIANRVEIIRVLHGRQDIQRHLT